MESFSYILAGFATALQPVNIWYTFIGCLMGTVVGVLPGLGPAAGMALLLPITFGMNPTSALIMLCAMYGGAMYGGSTTSILINTPGESSSVMTMLDGYQMAKKGRAGAALAVSAIGSFFAGTVGMLLLSLLAVPFSQFALRFGPAENFTLILFAMVMVSALTGKSMVRGMFAMVLGLIVCTIGIDLQSGMPRYTGGIPEVQDGISFLLAAVGLFAMSEVFCTFERHMKGKAEVLGIEGPLWLTRDEWKRSYMPIIRGTFIGFFKGMLPGGGATIATMIAYTVERSISKEKEKFGTGMIEGVAGPEAANNASSCGSMVPLFTLGLPGTGTTAVLMAALIMFGLQPGPLLLHKNPELVWSVIDSMYLGNLMLLILNLPLISIFVRILYIPTGILLPLIVVIATIGIYSINNSVFDLGVMLSFGVLGYVFRKVNISPAPMVLALVLGKPLEQSFRQAMTISGGHPAVFLSSAICIFFLGLTVAALFVYLVLPMLSTRKKPTAAAAT
ncbi:tripartite tricarboxylate transporter permease [Xanthobacteraceae bacterium Astr-EGSB]|uniref:tripartite tricarboxylate transporter permease n=1 Tax=Astrobacterium formosum TaxID=3069710 RepID=UPI0027AF3D50|nr:tripartite tricarboxylate transporter permease [Xanthobacteraceae bacterium Astr-EGSB]